MTTAMLFFLLKKNLGFYGTVCHILINGTAFTHCRSGEFFAIEASHSDSATYQAFLDEADKSISLFVKMKKNY